MQQLEFWLEYSSGPLWAADGQSIELDSLDLPASLRQRLADWNGRYDDSLLPFEDDDAEWLVEGRTLLADVRQSLSGLYEGVVTEPWWEEQTDA